MSNISERVNSGRRNWFIVLFGILISAQFVALAQELTRATPPIVMMTVTDAETSESKLPDLYEASIAELNLGLNKGLFTSVDLVKVRGNLYRILEIIHLIPSHMTLTGVFCKD